MWLSSTDVVSVGSHSKCYGHRPIRRVYGQYNLLQSPPTFSMGPKVEGASHTAHTACISQGTHHSHSLGAHIAVPAVACRCASDASLLHNDVWVYILSFSGQITLRKWLPTASMGQGESMHHKSLSLIIPPQNTVSDRALTSPCWLSRRCAPDASHDDVPVCILSTSGQIILRKWLPTASMGQGESIRHKSLRLILQPQTAVSDCVPTLACISVVRGAVNDAFTAIL